MAEGSPGLEGGRGVLPGSAGDTDGLWEDKPCGVVCLEGSDGVWTGGGGIVARRWRLSSGWQAVGENEGEFQIGAVSCR